MTSMFFGFISARPTEVVSIVNFAKPLMYASLSSYMGERKVEIQLLKTFLFCTLRSDRRKGFGSMCSPSATVTSMIHEML